jgi:excisionase family DNA binding protein
MGEMLTAKDVQELLQVDRSTVYRLAESNQLPAIKVGKQWRFPADQVENWFQARITNPIPVMPGVISHTTNAAGDLATLLPLECVQLIQDSFAEMLGVMLVITDMTGNPITKVSNPCGLFQTISRLPNALQRCIQSWHDLGTIISMEPRWKPSHLGLLCARSLIRVETELKGMVIAGCVAPSEWPPAPADVASMAAEFGVESELLNHHLAEVHVLDPAQQAKVLSFILQVANIVAHIVDEKKKLVGRLEAIAQLTIF